MNKQPCFESKILSQKIVAFKERKKLTYQELGDALGVDKSYINRVVKTSSFMSMPVLIRLAQFMEIPLYALFIPSAETIREDFCDTVKMKIREKNISTDELANLTRISPIRLIEILEENATITSEEFNLLTRTLEIKQSYYQQMNSMQLLDTLIKNLPMPESKQDSVIKYIADNLS